MPIRGILVETPPKTGMAQEPSGVEQAIVRALRDNLERIQRTADELHHSVSDVVSACASNKPTNALPSLLRARSEEHTSELQSRLHLVCRLLLEKKKNDIVTASLR